jgi:GNAT superfamily N-acetyltransferase
MSFFVRELAAGDAPAITRLSNQLGYGINLAETVENIKAIAENKTDRLFVAVDDTKVIGWIHIFHTTRLESGSFCEIGGLVVDDKYQKKGVGKMLIEKAASCCLDMGNQKLKVRCNTKRSAAHLFYSKFGFNENKEQKVFELQLEHKNIINK